MTKLYFQQSSYYPAMGYGKRLQEAMQGRSDTLGQTIERKDVARVADVSVQNIGMIINDAKGCDQNLGAKSHAAVCAYLKISSHWLLTGEGPMMPPVILNLPTELTPAAIELAVLFDMIATSEKINRARAFNAATSAIMQVLSAAPSTPKT
jgi:hypothetical protein